RSDNRLVHTAFSELPEFLEPGDCIVINTSRTLNAAINATRANGMPVELHLSTLLPSGKWSVELRRISEQGTQPLFDAEPGEQLLLAGGGSATLRAPHSRSLTRAPSVAYQSDAIVNANGAYRSRLWTASLDLPRPLGEYLDQYGFPIRYAYVPQHWPNAFYQ